MLQLGRSADHQLRGAAVNAGTPDAVAAGAIGGKASDWPSALQSMPTRSWLSHVMRVGVPPFIETMWISDVAPLMPRTNAMRVPSGETDGE